MGFFEDFANSWGGLVADTFDPKYKYKMGDKDYRWMQQVPLGHHYYGWGAGERKEYTDEYAWGGFEPPEGWYRGQVSKITPGEWVDVGIWNRREHTDFGQQFDPDHLMLLDLNVDPASGAHGPYPQWYHDGNKGMQPNLRPTGMPDDWVCGGPDRPPCNSKQDHCAKYPGAGIVWVPGGGSGGSYKQCCFQGDICQLEYDAALNNADLEQMGKGWGPATETYDFSGMHDTLKDAPIVDSVADTGMLVWTAPLGAAAELGAAAAFGANSAANDVIGTWIAAGRPAGAVVAADVLGSAGEDIGGALGGVVGGVGEDLGDGVGALEPPEPAEGQVPETPEETPPKPEEEAPVKPKPTQQVIGQTLADFANDPANLQLFDNFDNSPTSRAEPSITTPHSAELKQPDRYAPVSDDSIKLEGVLIAVVGIAAGALILRHYWPGK